MMYRPAATIAPQKANGRRSTSTFAGPVVLALALTTAGGLGFVFSSALRPAAMSKSACGLEQQQQQDTDMPLNLRGNSGFKGDGAASTSWSLTALVSIAVACGLVAQMGVAPAAAELNVSGLLAPPEFNEGDLPSDFDAEGAAQQANSELEQAKRDKVIMEKQARLTERLAIRTIVKEKEKAEQVVTLNVKAELTRISEEKRLGLEAAADRLKDARDRAVEANNLADSVGDDKRKEFMTQIGGMEPAKKILTKALAEKSMADDLMAERKAFVDKATTQYENAEKILNEKKAEVERSVLELSKGSGF